MNIYRVRHPVYAINAGSIQAVATRQKAGLTNPAFIVQGNPPGRTLSSAEVPLLALPHQVRHLLISDLDQCLALVGTNGGGLINLLVNLGR